MPLNDRDEYLSPRQLAERHELAADKARGRAREACREHLGQLGLRRQGVRAAEARLAADTSSTLLQGQELGFTYEEMSALVGLNRSRVAQLLAAARQAGEVPPSVPEPPAPELTPAPLGADAIPAATEL